MPHTAGEVTTVAIVFAMGHLIPAIARHKHIAL